jgi:hypothetical protein
MIFPTPRNNVLHVPVCPNHGHDGIVPLLGDEYACTICLCGIVPKNPPTASTDPPVLTEGEKMIWAAAYAWNVAEFGADCPQAAHDTVTQAREELKTTGGHPLDMLRAMVGR